MIQPTERRRSKDRSSPETEWPSGTFRKEPDASGGMRNEEASLSEADWYTVPQVCGVLSKSERTIRKYVRHYSIPTREVITGTGRELRIWKEAVDKLAFRLLGEPHPSGRKKKPPEPPSGSIRKHSVSLPEGDSATESEVNFEKSLTPALGPLAQMTRAEARELLTEAFLGALEAFNAQLADVREEKKAPTLEGSKYGRILYWSLYGTLVGMMTGALAYVWWMGAKFF